MSENLGKVGYRMIFKCKNCGGNSIYSPEHKGMYCPFCDSENSQERTDEAGDMKLCPNCGGELQVEEHTSAIQCPYCEHYIILNERVEGEYAPVKLIPFTYSKDMVKKLMKENFGKKIFAPTDFLSEVRLNSMEGEYVPFWLYDYDARCQYDGEGTKVHVHRVGDTEITETSYYHVVRDMSIHYKEIPADASLKMTDEIMDLMEPYQYQEMVDFQPQYLSGFLGEKYNLSAAELEGRARSKMSDSAETYLRQSISGYTRLVQHQKDVSIRDQKAKYVLLPVWKYIYKYKEQLYPFYINGQTGKIVGSVPISKTKVLVYGGTLWACLMAILGMIGYLA